MAQPPRQHPKYVTDVAMSAPRTTKTASIGAHLALMKPLFPKRAWCASILLFLVVCASTQADTKPVYKWTDEQGVVHYGDAVPPQYAERDQTVLNSQGIAVKSISGRKTPTQLAAEAARHESEDQALKTLTANQTRDRNLLATYLTVQEIESLRDRRLDLLDSQSRVAQKYLEQLKEQLHQLEIRAQRYRPYNSEPQARQMPANVADDLVRAAGNITVQQANLTAKQQEISDVAARFADDIARFEELKRIEAGFARGEHPMTGAH